MKRIQYPSPGELEVMLKDETLKRRQLRLNQVREQSKTLAADIRENVRREKALYFDLYQRKLTEEKKQTNENQIKHLQEMEQRCLQEFGYSHFLASQQPDLEAAQKTKEEQIAIKAEERGKRALSELHSQKKTNTGGNASSHHTARTTDNSTKFSKVFVPGLEASKKTKGNDVIYLKVINELYEDGKPPTRELFAKNIRKAKPHSTKFEVTPTVKVVSEKNSEININEDDAWTAALLHEISDEVAADRKAKQKAKEKKKAIERFHIASDLEAQLNCKLDPQMAITYPEEKVTQEQNLKAQKRKEQEIPETYYDIHDVDKQEKLEKAVESIFDMFSARSKRVIHVSPHTPLYSNDIPKKSSFEAKPPLNAKESSSNQFGNIDENFDWRTVPKRFKVSSTPEKNVGSSGTQTKTVTTVDAATGTDGVDAHPETPSSTQLSSSPSIRSSETSYKDLPSALDRSNYFQLLGHNIRTKGVGSPRMVENYLKSYWSHMAKQGWETEAKTVSSSLDPSSTIPFSYAPKHFSRGLNADFSARTTSGPDAAPNPPTPVIRQTNFTSLNTVHGVPDWSQTSDVSELLKKKLQGEVRHKIFPLMSEGDSQMQEIKMNSSERIHSPELINSKNSGDNYNKYLHFTVRPEDALSHSSSNLSVSTHYFPIVTADDRENHKSNSFLDLSFIEDKDDAHSTVAKGEHDSMSEQQKLIKTIVANQLMQKIEENVDLPDDADVFSVPFVTQNSAAAKRRPPVALKGLPPSGTEFIPHELSTIEEKESVGQQSQVLHDDDDDDDDDQSQINKQTPNIEAIKSLNSKFNADSTSFMDLTIHSKHTVDKQGNTVTEGSVTAANGEDASEWFSMTPGSFSKEKSNLGSIRLHLSFEQRDPRTDKTDTIVVDSSKHKEPSGSDSSTSSVTSIKTPSLSAQSYYSVPTPSLFSEEDSVFIRREEFWNDVLQKALVGDKSNAGERLGRLGSDFGSIASLKPSQVVDQSTPVKNMPDFVRKEHGILEEADLTLVDLESTLSESKNQIENLDRTLSDLEVSLLSHLNNIQEEKKVLIEATCPAGGKQSASESLLSFLLHEMSIAASASSSE